MRIGRTPEAVESGRGMERVLRADRGLHKEVILRAVVLPCQRPRPALSGPLTGLG